MWPFRKSEPERRSTFTDAQIAALIAGAEGSKIVQTATGSLETAAGMIGRAFQVAEVAGPPMLAAGLPPEVLGLIGRSLIRRGEALFRISVTDDGLSLLPASSWDVRGGADPARWRYRVTVQGPDEMETWRDLPADAVVHLRYAFEPEAPWRGLSPLQVASLSRRLSAELAGALADEASGPRGAFLPVPIDGSDPTLAGMKTGIAKAKGDLLLTEAGDWDRAGGGAGSGAWTPRRFGAAPPEALVKLHEQVSREVLAACGIPPALVDVTAAAAAREAFRQLLFGTVAPLGKAVAGELSRKLDAEIELGWSELRAADIVSRARGFQSMVQSGMEPAKAAALAGLMAEGD